MQLKFDESTGDIMPKTAAKPLGYYENRKISNSLIKEFCISPLHFWQKWYFPDKEETEAMKFGSALHMAIGEPELFAKTYVLKPEGNANSNAYKAEVALIESKGQIIISQKQMIACEVIPKRIRRHTKLRQWLQEGIPEFEHYFQCGGLDCKLRADLWVPEREVVVDWKTCVSGHPDDFTRTCYYEGYLRQLAFYADNLGAKKAFIVAIEKEPPYAIMCYMINPEHIAMFRQEYQKAIEGIKYCMETYGENEWPGYEWYCQSDLEKTLKILPFVLQPYMKIAA